MATMETKKATRLPTNSITSSGPVNANPNLTNFNKLAPNITGMARKKVNSAAIFLDVPTSIAPSMVAPDLDVPGIRANTWNRPMAKAILYVSSEKSFTKGLLYRFLFSITINRIP